MKSVHANPPEKICRLCLSDSGVILPIFEGEIAERFSVPLPQKILSCLAIKVLLEVFREIYVDLDIFPELLISSTIIIHLFHLIMFSNYYSSVRLLTT